MSLSSSVTFSMSVSSCCLSRSRSDRFDLFFILLRRLCRASSWISSSLSFFSICLLSAPFMGTSSSSDSSYIPSAKVFLDNSRFLPRRYDVGAFSSTCSPHCRSSLAAARAFLPLGPFFFSTFFFAMVSQYLFHLREVKSHIFWLVLREQALVSSG